MGLKKGKYIYVELGKDRYVKVRVLKGRAEDNPSRYIPLNTSVKKPPRTAKVVRAADLPSEIVSKISPK
ncbi:MAG: DUF5622 domain-containing protein [Sulfolobales archaeon]